MKTLKEIKVNGDWTHVFSKKKSTLIPSANGNLSLGRSNSMKKVEIEPKKKLIVLDTTELGALNLVVQNNKKHECNVMASCSSSASSDLDYASPPPSPNLVVTVADDPEDGKPPVSNHGADVCPPGTGGNGDKRPQNVVQTWWETASCGVCEFKSGKETTLLLWIIFLSAFSLSLLASLAVISLKWQDETAGVCITPHCVITAEKVIRSLDTRADPCVDFFNYSCGGWILRNPIPESSSNWDQFDILKEKMNLEIKEILEADPVPTDPEAVLLGQKLYKMCMSENNSGNHTNLRDLAISITEAREREKWQDIGPRLGRIRRELSGNFILSMYVFFDEKEPTKNTIYIDAPHLGLAKPHFQDPVSVKAYESLVADIWDLVFPQSEMQGRRIAEDIVSFEKQLAGIATPMEKRRNRTTLYNVMVLEDLEKIMPNESNWRAYFNEIFVETGVGINWETQRIIAKDLAYFKNLGNVLSATRFSTIRNYLKWRIIFQLGSAASSKIHQRIFQYTKTTIGVQYPPPTWKICSTWVNRHMGWAVSYKYVQLNFPKDFKKEVSSIVKDIRDGFYQILRESTWIAEETKQIAFRKAAAMRSFIAYPEWLLENRTALNSEFLGLLNQTYDTNHFENFIKVTKWSAAKALGELMKEKDYNTWISYSTMVNAFYSASYNAIAFPAGILQKPFYGHPLQSMNYGGIGAIIGHEITHAFDDEGSQSDENGKLTNWWDTATLQRYTAKAKCFVEQYGNFTLPGLNITLNGINTQGENIADNGGLRQAFRGYKAWVKRNGKEERLPGIVFTPDQLFFIAFAQSLCGSFRSKYLEQFVKTSRHSPWQFQVLGSVANSLDFAKTWNCKVPKAPCQIW